MSSRPCSFANQITALQSQLEFDSMKHRHGGHADRDGNDFNIVGGQSFTDLPIRTGFYPSYGVYSATPSMTLVASYRWTYDLAP